MEPLTKNNFMDRLKNPAIWFIVIAFIGTMAISLNNIKENTKDNVASEQKTNKRVDVIHERLTKKIEVQNQIIQDLKDQEIKLLTKEIEFWKNHFNQQLEIEKLKVHVEYLKKEHK
ncbi:MAG: hypothetical protein H8E98_02670 [Bacteroidetes bacterium]|nr:hypothetical protein [Bacteroidota bacterium]